MIKKGRSPAKAKLLLNSIFITFPPVIIICNGHRNVYNPHHIESIFHFSYHVPY